ncbi:conjugative transfer protein MobI(A/C) [Pseudomonas sp. NPDC047961]
MHDEALTKRQISQRKEDEEDLAFLLSLEGAELDFIDWERCMRFSRRRMKRALKILAQRVADDFWVTNWQHRLGDGVPKEFGQYGVRIVDREWTIYAQWYRLEVKGSPQCLKKRMDSIQPSKGSHRVSEKQFGHAKDWELEAIMKAEEKLEKVRRCANRLENIRLQLSSVVQLMKGLRETTDGTLPEM